MPRRTAVTGKVLCHAEPCMSLELDRLQARGQTQNCSSAEVRGRFEISRISAARSDARGAPVRQEDERRYNEPFRRWKLGQWALPSGDLHKSFYCVK